MAGTLGLADSAPWHSDRNGFLRLASWLGRVAAALGKIGADLAILSRGEVAEVTAGTGGGSSTMPHKSNPIAAEALQSLAVLAATCEGGLRAAAVHAEERDGVSWPLEWELLPALFETAGAALERAAALVPTIRADAEAMSARIAGAPEVLAEAAVFALASRIGRAEAQRVVAEALGAAEPFLDALAARAGFDVNSIADAGTFTGPSGAVIDQIFGTRQSRN
jgi:3-carboxy-cis,cis-muconate cycloisomerase